MKNRKKSRKLSLCLLAALLVLSLLLSACDQSPAAPAAPAESAAAETPAVPAEKAPGTAGELKLYDTDPRDAAMIMAIVADTLGKPLNELRFISIREVKEDEV